MPNISAIILPINEVWYSSILPLSLSGLAAENYSPKRDTDFRRVRCTTDKLALGINDYVLGIIILSLDSSNKETNCSSGM